MGKRRSDGWCGKTADPDGGLLHLDFEGRNVEIRPGSRKLLARNDPELCQRRSCKLGKIGENPEMPGKAVMERNLKGRDSSFLGLP